MDRDDADAPDVAARHILHLARLPQDGWRPQGRGRDPGPDDADWFHLFADAARVISLERAFGILIHSEFP